MGFAPQIRADLQFSSGDASWVVVTDPRAHQQGRLNAFEYRLVQQMNGARSVDELLHVARAHAPRVTLEQLETFLSRLMQLGWLAEDTPESSARTIIDPEFISGLEEPAPNEGGYGKVLDFPGVPQPASLMGAVPSEPEADADPTVRAPSLEFDDEDEDVQLVVPAGSVEVGIDDGGEIVELGADDGGEIEEAKEAEEVAAEIEEVGADVAVEAPEEAPAPPWHVRYRAWRAPALLLAGLVCISLIPYPLYVTEECVVSPQHRVEVRAQVDGIINEILVDEAARVKAGDVIARLDDREVHAALKQAQAKVQRLNARLTKVKKGHRREEIASARAAVGAATHDVKYASVEYRRRQNLLKQGVGSAESRDKARRDLEVKRSQLRRAQAELKLLTAGYREEEIRIAEADLKGAEVEAAFHAGRLERLTIKAPIDGVVSTPKFKERLHEKVAAGDPICKIAETGRVKVEILVPEQEIDEIQVGQSTVVKVRSLPLHPFKGKVTFIAPAVEVRKDRRVVRVVTEIDNSEGLLQEGATGYGEIYVERSTLLKLALRRAVRWVRVRFLI